MYKLTALMLVASTTLSAAAFAEGTRKPAPDGAEVFIISPENGASVSGPVTVLFGLKNMGVAPAGTAKENTGHHHLLIDTDPATLDLDEGLPATDNIVHFGGGQTQVTTELPAGKHQLILLLADENHVPFDPPIVSDPIEIIVE